MLALTTELQVRYAFVSERMVHDARALVMADRKNLQQPFSYQHDAPSSPCRTVYAGEVLALPCDVSKRFPGEEAEAYVGVPLKSAAGDVIGVLAVLHDQALPVARLEPVTWTLRAMAPRVAAELECMRLARPAAAASA